MKLLAPKRHTALLIGVFVALAVGGAISQRVAATRADSRSSPIPLYIALIAGECGLVLLVSRGAKRYSGTTLRAWVGGDWSGAPAVATDIALALGLWGAWKGVDALWAHAFGGAGPTVVGNLLPRGAPERALWIVLSLCAGFAEELTFRGYFLRQFTAFTRRPWIALVLQAALFGIAHGYQGARARLEIALYGALFGVMALWRRNLRPCMMAHAWTDIVGGLAGG